MWVMGVIWVGFFFVMVLKMVWSVLMISFMLFGLLF